MAKKQTKRNKKYNPNNKLFSIEEGAIKNTWIVGSTFFHQADLNINMSAGKHLPEATKNAVISNAVNRMQKRKMHWTVLVAICQVDSNNKPFMDTLIKVTDKPYLAEEDAMTDFIHDMKVELVKNCNDKFIVTANYICIPNTGLCEDALVEQAQTYFIEKNCFNKEACLPITKLKYSTMYPDTVAGLKEANRWGTLGEIVKYSILGTK